MTSGDLLAIFTPQNVEPVASNPATLDRRNGHFVLDFDASTDEFAVFPFVLPDNYSGGGVDIEIVWMASSATTGNTVWSSELERHQDDTDDLDSDSFAAAQSATAAAPSASGETSYDTISHTDGAQMDSLVAGESGRIRISRDADNASDTMTGDAELLRVIVRET